MRALILYDSAYGNTEKIAQAIAHAMAPKYKADAVPIWDANVTDLITSDLIVVGSPTQGGRPTAALQRYLTNLPVNILNGTRVAAFDTRFGPDHGFMLWQLTKILGFAATRIAKLLKTKRGTLVAPPKGFIVKDKEGPLQKGEIEQAERWAKNLVHHTA